MRSLVAILLVFTTINAHSTVNTSGVISEFYARDNGNVALKLDQGFTENALNECPGNNGYAGISGETDPMLRSTLLAAFTAGKRVRLTVDGCLNNWLKIQSVFVTP